jgi:hypothetical protein
MEFKANSKIDFSTKRIEYETTQIRAFGEHFPITQLAVRPDEIEFGLTFFLKDSTNQDLATTQFVIHCRIPLNKIAGIPQLSLLGLTPRLMRSIPYLHGNSVCPEYITTIWAVVSRASFVVSFAMHLEDLIMQAEKGAKPACCCNAEHYIDAVIM